MQQRLAVIIPTRNRASQLRRCLEALARQSCRPDAVYVVNDGGASPEPVVSSFRQMLVIHLLETDSIGPAGARNAAIEQLTAPYVAFLDDDSVPERDWSSACVGLFDDHPKATAQLGRILWTGDSDSVMSLGQRFLPQLRQKVYDSRHLRFTDESFRNQVQQSLGDEELSQLPGLSTHLSGGNCAIRKEFLDDQGVFDVRFRTLSDREMAYRILGFGGVIAYNPLMRVAHQHDPSIIRAQKRCYRAAAYQRLLDQVHGGLPAVHGAADRFVTIQQPLSPLERIYLAVHRTTAWWATHCVASRSLDPLASASSNARRF